MLLPYPGENKKPKLYCPASGQSFCSHFFIKSSKCASLCVLCAPPHNFIILFQRCSRSPSKLKNPSIWTCGLFLGAKAAVKDLLSALKQGISLAKWRNWMTGLQFLWPTITSHQSHVSHLHVCDSEIVLVSLSFRRFYMGSGECRGFIWNNFWIIIEVFAQLYQKI